MQHFTCRDFKVFNIENVNYFGVTKNVEVRVFDDCAVAADKVLHSLRSADNDSLIDIRIGLLIEMKLLVGNILQGGANLCIRPTVSGLQSPGIPDRLTVFIQ
jgi:hypothetical protein